MKSLSQLLRLFCTLVLTLPVLISGFSAHAQQQVVFADSPYPPYVLGEIGNEKPFGGTAVDLVRQLFDELPDYQASFQLMPWKRVLRSLQEGSVDGVTMVAYTQERATYLDFSAALVEYQLALFYSKEAFPNGFEWETLSDLSEFNIGVVEGYLSDSKMHEFVEQGAPLTLLRLSGTEDQLFGMLMRGRVDLICFKLGSGKTLLRQKGWNDMIQPNAKPVYQGSYHLGFSKAMQHQALMEKLDAYINAWQETGKLQAILHPHSPDN
ncbi:substrate-binding periplasmic protein [Alteromonas sediminis]|uniref:substrate-binding periplasmic protein n=1 Tax=Alteromonas sediminis TaxID=2259342 RepID=UPI0014047828|nr:transporter substrate-binding domain-containing protein [Alteromonas sediminis]